MQREKERERYIPTRSAGTFPLPNLPVGTLPLKSFPYGAKLHLTTLFRWLLLPVSTIESPKAITAGTEIFCGSLKTALVLQKRTKAMRLNNTIAEEEKEDKLKRNCIFFFLLDESLLFGY